MPIAAIDPPVLHFVAPNLLRVTMFSDSQVGYLVFDRSLFRRKSANPSPASSPPAPENTRVNVSRVSRSQTHRASNTTPIVMDQAAAADARNNQKRLSNGSMSQFAHAQQAKPITREALGDETKVRHRSIRR